jgi:hypothetical protein
MIEATLERRPNVALVGGLTDTESTLHTLAAPLAPGHQLFYLPGNWGNRDEPERAKTARIRDKLAWIAKEHGPLTVVGVSAGGPLALAAGHDVEGVEGFATLSSPLREPTRMTLMLRAAKKLYPQLPSLIAKVAETVLPHLPAEQGILFRGTRDIRVPPYMSTVDGFDNQVVETPRTVFASSHSHNVRAAFASPALRRFIAATAGAGR